MGFDNVNVNVSGPVQPTSTYKTKVLKGNHSFASQVTEPNTKYVIKHDFVLDGDITVPANCVLEFDGGSISGEHTVIFQNTTILNACHSIKSVISGTLANKQIFLSWFENFDIANIQNILDNIQYQEFVFDEDWNVTVNYDETWEDLIKLKSNTIISSYNNSKIKVSSNTIQGWNSLFGTYKDRNIENIAFVGLTVVSSVPNESVNISFVKLDGINNEEPEYKIKNVVVKDCIVNRLGNLVYIVHHSNLGTDDERTTENVLIQNCKMYGYLGSFVTADGKDITIKDCYAEGGLSDSYDAVSIHSGINVTIENNTFKSSNRSDGICINIRNSSENKCGTKCIKVVNNRLSDYTNSKAIQVGTSFADATVTDILIQGNSINNCNGGIVISNANGGQNCIEDINIIGNKINGLLSGIFISQSINSKIKSVNIIGNSISVSDSSEEHWGIYLMGVNQCHISNNNIKSTHNSGFNYCTQCYVDNNFFAGKVTIENSSYTFILGNGCLKKLIIDNIRDYIIDCNKMWSGMELIYNNITIGLSNIKTSTRAILYTFGAGQLPATTGPWLDGDKVEAYSDTISHYCWSSSTTSWKPVNITV